MISRNRILMIDNAGFLNKIKIILEFLMGLKSS
jgi:hypothetical protein